LKKARSGLRGEVIFRANTNHHEVLAVRFKRFTSLIIVVTMILLGICTAQAQVEAVAKRPFYTLSVTLDPVSGRANGTVLIQYVNPTEQDLYNVAFALDPGRSRTKPVSRARVNRRNAEVIYRSCEEGDAFDGFELVSSRRMPPGVISQIEIFFETRDAYEANDLTWYTGDWFPRVIGQVDTNGVPLSDPNVRGLGDYDVTVEFPIEWRAALSGLPLREDGRGDGVEIYNGAAGVTNYGVALARNLLVQETEVFGIRVRVFFLPSDAEWATKLLGDTRNVVEFFKRRTAFKPPLVLNVIPGDKDKEGAEACFANSIMVHRGGPRPSTYASRISVAKAVTDLYWGFDNISASTKPQTPMETAFSRYGALRFARGVGIGDDWTNDLQNEYFAGILYHRLVKESLGAGIELPEPSDAFANHTEIARQFVLLKMLEQQIGEDAFERIYDELFVFAGERSLDKDRLRNVVAVVAEDSLDEFFDTWYNGQGWFDARLKNVRNRGTVSGKQETLVEIERSGAVDVPIPLLVTLLDSSKFTQVVPANETSTVIRSDVSVALVEVDPEFTLPILNHSWKSGSAVAMVTDELGRGGNWGRALDVVKRASGCGVGECFELELASAKAKMHTGDYYGAKEDVLKSLNLEASGPGLLLLGQVLDLLGDRVAAEDAYHRAQQFDAVAADAGKYLKTPYSMKE